MSADYAPLDEPAIEQLAMWHDGRPVSRPRDIPALLRNALLHVEALRERCLIAETENAQLRRQLRHLQPGIHADV